jgi:hypothetical protein
VEADGDATWQVRYGTASDALDWSTTPQQVPVGIRPGAVGVSAALTGLPPATRIYARLVVSGDKKEKLGAMTSFTTDPAPGTTAPAPQTPPATGTPQPESPTATPSPTTTPTPAAAPELGTQVGAAATRGSVRVRLRGSDEFVALPDAAGLPVGSVIDATRGAITLTAALPGGQVQAASFGGGRFKVAQRVADGRVDLRLRGGDFAACRARTLSAMTSGKRRRAVRRVWGKDRSGRFRTHGRDSVTTVRGTEWTVADRCNGTVTRVTEGAVDVRVRRTGRIVRLEAGERFLARHHR